MSKSCGVNSRPTGPGSSIPCGTEVIYSATVSATIRGNTLTLSTRLSVFFLTTLGLVLIGFSAVFFLLAKTYVHRQTNAQLESAINTLVAAVEIAPDGVEWEPAQRS